MAVESQDFEPEKNLEKAHAKQSISTNTENDVLHQYRGDLGTLKAFGEC